jgi:hypothetical protein
MWVMLKIEAYAHIEQGRLILDNRKKMDAEIKECQDCAVIVTIKKRGKRSTPQNNYYHGIIVENVRHRLVELGHRVTHDEVHEEIKRLFLPEPLVDEHGVVIFEKAGSTTEMNKSEFSEFIERIREWSAGALGIDIPDPNSNNEMDF